jgi:hypothetical protein
MLCEHTHQQALTSPTIVLIHVVNRFDEMGGQA